MTEVLFLILFAAMLFSWHKFEQKLKEKSERYQWLHRENDRFHIIALDFEKQCKECIEQTVPLHNQRICNNRKGSISDFQISMWLLDNKKLLENLSILKNEYLNELTPKYESRYGTLYIENYPDHLFNDYRKEIEQIYSHYQYIIWLMRDQIIEMNPPHNI